MKKTNPTSLYIHIPFCKYLCDYCDFPKLQYFSSFINPYLDALKVELDSYDIKELKTIYVGGGTPTSLSNDELEKLLNIIKPYSYGVIEYSFEANPDSLDKSKLKLLKRYGVNRLSIGVESTDDNILKLINRYHSFNDVIRCVDNAKEVGFTNINVDLILGLPHASKALIKQDIENLIKLEVSHISCYSLTVNEHTRFFIKNIKAPHDDLLREYYDLVNNELEKVGYIHYEISNWAKVDKYSLHNLTYWKDESYYGVGLGASGYINGIRYTNTKSINKYLAHQFIYEKEEITLEDDISYYIMLNLRTMWGISLKDFNDKFHYDLLLNKEKEIKELVSKKLLIIKDNHLIPTYKGMMLLDSILLILID